MIEIQTQTTREQAQGLPVLLVSTCGTSLLTNYAPDLKGALFAAANLSESEVDPDLRARVEDLVQDIRTWLSSAPLGEIRRASAELNGILSYYEGDLHRGRADQHYFLTTDTYLGRLAGECLAEWIRPHVGSASAVPIQDLNTRSPDAFREGAKKLVEFFGNLGGSGHQGYRVVLNCIGGFKAFQAYASAIGLLYGHEQFYLFESEGSPLIRIPGLPVRQNLEGVVAEHFDTLRKLSLGMTLSRSQVQGIPETLLFLHGDEAVLDAWGKLAWDTYGRKAYREKLLDPPADVVRYDPKFEASVARLEPDRLEQVNERIDDLCSYLLEGAHRNERPRSRLDLKPLRADGKGTHEIDAWSDGKAARIFLDLSDGRATLLELAEKLPG